MAVTAALALASCTSEDALNQAVQKPAEDGAVTFSAYTGRAVTRGATLGTPVTSANELAYQGGFGVYAFEQGPLAWATYSASNTYPNFFYNQQVKGYDNTDADLSGKTTGDVDNWAYSPVKYFSNNKDAKHSFFAYAPYQKTPNVVFNNNGPAIRYNANDNYDLLWAAPTRDLLKPGVSHKIEFQFEHALSKVDFEVAYFIDEVHSTDHTTTENLGSGTTITLRSVKFVGAVPSQGLLSLADGNWTYETAEASAYEFCPVGTVKVDVAADATPVTHKPVSSNNLVLPTSTNLPVKIQVIYDVETVDATNPQNSSKITNTVTSQEEFQLVKGTAYKFSLDLGLTSVKFKAAVTAWTPTTPTGIEVDLPNNSNWHPIAYVSPVGTATPAAQTITEVAAKPATTATTDYYYNTTDNKMYKGKATNDWEEVTTAAIYYDATSKKYYDVADDATTTVYSGTAAKVGSTYYIGKDAAEMATNSTVYNLTPNSEGKIQTDTDASAAASWTAPENNKYYTYTVGTTTYLLQWRTTAD